MLTLPTGYHALRFVFRHSGIADSMGFSLAFAPYLDGNQAEVVAGLVHDAFVSSTVWSLASIPNTYIWESVQDTQMLQEGPVTAIFPVNDTGQASGQTIPPNCALLVRKVTSLGGRTNRGRFYMPPFLLTDGNVDNAGVITPAPLALIQADLEAFHAKLVTDGLDPVLLHSDPLETPTPVVGLTAQSVIATQRRRIR